MDNTKSARKELDILLMDTLSFNEEILETLELLSEELDFGMSFNVYKPNSLAH